MSKKIWFGLTGGIATGKSTVSGLLSEMGAHIIDADLLAREAIKPKTLAYQKIIKTFGEEIVLSNGEIDRKALGRVIFSDKNLRKKLEEIVHPEVRKLSLKKLAEAEKAEFSPIFYDVPLLFEAGMQDLFRGVIVVACDKEVQLQRLMDRDGITKEEALSKVQSQLSMEKKVEAADFVVWNNSSLADLKEETKNIMSFLAD